MIKHTYSLNSSTFKKLNTFKAFISLSLMQNLG